MLGLVHPFERWETSTQVVAIAAAALVVVVSLALFLGLEKTMKSTDGKGKGKGKGKGMVAFELAGSKAKASQIMTGWSEPQRKPMRAALGSLVLDFPFLAAYGLGLALLAALLAESARRHGWVGAADVAAAVAWSALVAAAADLVEDVVLLVVLAAGWKFPSQAPGGWPTVARAAAILKFGLLALVAVFIASLAVTGALSFAAAAVMRRL